MKANVIKMILLSAFLFGMLALQNCKKDTLLPKGPMLGNDSSLATLTAATAMPSYVVSTLVGRDPISHVPLISYPFYICTAADGLMYVTSPIDGAIYKITPQGSLTKYLNYDQPYGIKAGANGSLYFLSNISGSSNGDIDSSIVIKADKNKKTTILPVKEKLSQVIDLAIGPDSSIYLPDYLDNQIVKFTKQGVTSILAGKRGVKGYADGQGENAHFTNPTFVKFGEDGNLWVVDGAIFNPGQSIRKVSMTGQVTTLYRLNPQYTNQTLIEAFAVTKRDKNFNLTPYENVFFFVRTYTQNNKVVLNQLFHLSHDKVLTPITGNLPEVDNYKDGPASQATFFNPTSISINPSGIYVTDDVTGVIRKIVKQ